MQDEFLASVQAGESLLEEALHTGVSADTIQKRREEAKEAAKDKAAATKLRMGAEEYADMKREAKKYFERRGKNPMSVERYITLKKEEEAKEEERRRQEQKSRRSSRRGHSRHYSDVGGYDYEDEGYGLDDDGVSVDSFGSFDSEISNDTEMFRFGGGIDGALRQPRFRLAFKPADKANIHSAVTKRFKHQRGRVVVKQNRDKLIVTVESKGGAQSGVYNGKTVTWNR